MCVSTLRGYGETAYKATYTQELLDPIIPNSIYLKYLTIKTTLILFSQQNNMVQSTNKNIGFNVPSTNINRNEFRLNSVLNYIVTFASFHLPSYQTFFNREFAILVSKIATMFRQNPAACVAYLKMLANWARVNMGSSVPRQLNVPESEWDIYTHTPVLITHIWLKIRSADITEDERRLAYRILLSFLESYQVVTVPRSPDLSTITAPYTGLQGAVDSIGVDAAILDLGLEPSQNSLALHRAYRDATYHTSSSAGPNGQAIWTSHVDAQAVLADQELFSHMCSFASLVGFDGRIADLQDASNHPRVFSGRNQIHHSKLHVIFEKGDKARVIAILDYWTQELLTPLHDVLASNLRALSTDGTFDQDRQAERVRQFTAQKGSVGVYSLDLSAATDRLPITLQAKVLDALTGVDGIGSAWANLLTQRDFVTELGGGVRYAVGQPMGAKTSFPMLALTHHVLVRHAALTIGKPGFTDYAILGDDIVIADTDVAQAYQDVMESIGMDIALHKTIISAPSAPMKAAEFCKRLFVGGLNYSPLPVKLILEANNHPDMSYQLQEELGKRDLLHKEFFPTWVVHIIGSVGLKQLAFLNSLPSLVTGMHHSFLFPGFEHMDYRRYDRDRHGFGPADIFECFTYSVIVEQLKRLNSVLNNTKDLAAILLKSVTAQKETGLVLRDGAFLHTSQINLDILRDFGFTDHMHPVKEAILTDVDRINTLLLELSTSSDEGRHMLVKDIVDSLRITMYDPTKLTDLSIASHQRSLIQRLFRNIKHALDKDDRTLSFSIKLEGSPNLWFVKFSLGSHVILSRTTAGSRTSIDSLKATYQSAVKSSTHFDPADIL